MIEGAKDTERKLIEMDPSRTMSNNRLRAERNSNVRNEHGEGGLWNICDNT